MPGTDFCLLSFPLLSLCQTSHPILSFMLPTVSLILFPFPAPQPFRGYQCFKPLILIMWAHFFLVELPHSTLVTSTIRYIFTISIKHLKLFHPSPVQKYVSFPFIGFSSSYCTMWQIKGSYVFFILPLRNGIFVNSYLIWMGFATVLTLSIYD